MTASSFSSVSLDPPLVSDLPGPRALLPRADLARAASSASACSPRTRPRWPAGSPAWSPGVRRPVRRRDLDHRRDRGPAARLRARLARLPGRARAPRRRPHDLRRRGGRRPRRPPYGAAALPLPRLGPVRRRAARRRHARRRRPGRRAASPGARPTRGSPRPAQRVREPASGSGSLDLTRDAARDAGRRPRRLGRRAPAALVATRRSGRARRSSRASTPSRSYARPRATPARWSARSRPSAPTRPSGPVHPPRTPSRPSAPETVLAAVERLRRRRVSPRSASRTRCGTATPLRGARRCCRRPSGWPGRCRSAWACTTTTGSAWSRRSPPSRAASTTSTPPSAGSTARSPPRTWSGCSAPSTSSTPVDAPSLTRVARRLRRRSTPTRPAPAGTRSRPGASGQHAEPHAARRHRRSRRMTARLHRRVPPSRPDRRRARARRARRVGAAGDRAPRPRTPTRAASSRRATSSCSADAGLLGLVVPEEYGGLGGGLRDLAATTYALGTVCGSTALAYFFHCSASSRGLLPLAAIEAGLYDDEEVPVVRAFAEKVLHLMGRDEARSWPTSPARRSRPATPTC